MIDRKVLEVLRLFNKLNIDFYLYGGFSIDIIRGDFRIFHKDFDIFIDHEVFLDDFQKIKKQGYALSPILRKNKLESINLLDNRSTNLRVDIKFYKTLDIIKGRKLIVFSSSPVICPKIFLSKYCLNYNYQNIKIKILPVELLYIFTYLADKPKRKEMNFLKGIITRNNAKKERVLNLLKLNIDFYEATGKYNNEIKGFVRKLKRGLKNIDA